MHDMDSIPRILEKEQKDMDIQICMGQWKETETAVRGYRRESPPKNKADKQTENTKTSQRNMDTAVTLLRFLLVSRLLVVLD